MIWNAIFEPFVFDVDKTKKKFHTILSVVTSVLQLISKLTDIRNRVKYGFFMIFFFFNKQQRIEFNYCFIFVSADGLVLRRLLRFSFPACQRSTYKIRMESILIDRSLSRECQRSEGRKIVENLMKFEIKIGTYISVDGGWRSGSVQMAVKLIQHVTKTLLVLFVRMDKDGLEVHGETISWGRILKIKFEKFYIKVKFETFKLIFNLKLQEI